MSEKQQLQLIKDDGWLSPYEYELDERVQTYNDLLGHITKAAGSLQKFAEAHLFLGFNYDTKKKGWYYREWAPAASALALFGDFNNWNKESHPLTKKDGGIWEIFIPDSSKTPLKHESLLKVIVTSDLGVNERIPAYVTRVVQDEKTHDFAAQIWNPEKKFKWTDKSFSTKSIGNPIIYECHVGMAQEKEGVGTYREFADIVLPRIIDLGYNAIQMMAIQEHPYYGSFGYHVSSFFAPSSRFGTPEDLKYLINKAHKAGVAVIMDIVHSHAVKNINEGLNMFDGTDYQYFHGGGKGDHSAWDSKLFNYGKWEVMQFLLSNVKYWIDEFHFDGFRFDGVTSMLYSHHGHTAFDHYDKYFKWDVEKEAVTYLQLANTLIHEIKPDALSIAEDVSGMPGLCRPTHEGGIGFDYRLGMGIPDFWIKILKEKRDEDWNIHELLSVMTNRRHNEKTIAYAESHDQALVGDKTLAFWLMDAEMYWKMQVSDQSLIIDRGIALHKLIRIFTMATGGEGYLTFIGNEFGHPEWVDFPREGNNWSYKYARRQWSLADNKDLKYQYLNNFDREMVQTLKENQSLTTGLNPQVLNMDETNSSIVFKKGDLIFVFNFHPSNSIADYEFYVPENGSYKIILNSDAKDLGGFDRIDTEQEYIAKDNRLKIYNVNRTVQIFKLVK